MVRVFSVCLRATGTFGFRLGEERRRRDPEDALGQDEDCVRTRTKVLEIKPWAKQKLKLLEPGDVLFQVGYKGQSAKTWHWEMISRLPFEKVITIISESKRAKGKVLLKFIRPDENSPSEKYWIARSANGIFDCDNDDENNLEDEEKKDESETPVQKLDNVKRSTSVRVGEQFQCNTIPALEVKINKSSFKGDQLFDPSRVDPDLVGRYFSDLLEQPGDKTKREIDALRYLHSCDYNILAAMEHFKKIQSDIEQDPWTHERRQAFEQAIRKVGCRDYRAIRDEIDPSIPLGEVVVYYFSIWKPSEAYKVWENETKLNIRPGRKCERCFEDDPYEEALKCSSCEEYLCHLECMEPPIVNVPQLSSKHVNWKCSKCLKLVANKSATSQHVQSSTVLNSFKSENGSNLPPPPPPPMMDLPPYHVVSSGRRSAAAAAANIWAMNTEDRRGSSNSKRKTVSYSEESASDDGEDADFVEGKKRHKKLKPANEGGMKLHHLKGKVIDPDILLQIVEQKGGYESVVANKLWQEIRKEMDLSKSTSSSHQIKEAYHAYVEYANKATGSAEV